MQKSEPGRPAPRAALRDLAGAKRSDRLAATSGIALALVLLIGTLWLAFSEFEARLGELRVATHAAAETVAAAISRDIETALGYGIPFDEMRGVDEYLSAVLAEQRLVATIAVRGRDERRVHGVASGRPAGSPVRVPILLGDRLMGAVVVGASEEVVGQARERLIASAIASAILLALICALLLRHASLELRDLPRARFGASAAAVGRGVLSDFTAPERGPPRQFGREGAARLAPLRRSYRRLAALTEEVRALDTSARLKAETDAALAPLRRFVFDRPRERFSTTAASLWWPFLALTALLADRPLVASFAADRIGSGAAASLAIAATLVIDVIGIAAGLLLAAYGPLRGSRFVSFIGMTIAGVAIGVTYVLRDPTAFALAQFASGLFGAWGVAAALRADGGVARAPFRVGLVVLAAFAVGPTLGAILAESEGRRFAFLTLGALSIVVALLVTLASPRRPRAVPVRRKVPASAALSLVATGAVVASAFDIHLPATVLRENYAGLAMVFALAGAAALTPGALLPAIPARAAAPGALLAALAAAALALLPATASVGVPLGLAVVLLGAGLGLTLYGLGRTLFSPLGLAFVLLGILVAAVGETAGAVLELPGLVLTAAAAVVLSLLAVLAALPGRRD